VVIILANSGEAAPKIYHHPKKRPKRRAGGNSGSKRMSGWTGRRNGGVDGYVPSLGTVPLYSDLFRMSG